MKKKSLRITIFSTLTKILLPKNFISHIFILLIFFCAILSANNLSDTSSQQKKLGTRDLSHKIFSEKANISISELPIIYKNGILFTFIGKDQDQVYVSGSFVGWKKKLKMSQSNQGVFYVFFEENLPTGKYDYKINVNGFWQNDTKQPLHRINKNGQKVTYFLLEKPIVYHKISPEKISEKKFRFYLIDKNYKDVRWLGSENRFDPQVNKMKLSNGYWVIEKTVERGHHFYAYFVDGKMMLDPHNGNLSTTKSGLTVNFIPDSLYKNP